jgi:hypothetical protein
METIWTSMQNITFVQCIDDIVLMEPDEQKVDASWGIC